MAEPLFFAKAEVLAFHSEQIDLFGGSHGLGDETLLESALASPENTYCLDLGVATTVWNELRRRRTRGRRVGRFLDALKGLYIRIVKA